MENGCLTVESTDSPTIAEVYIFTATKYRGSVSEPNGLYFYLRIIIPFTNN